MSVSLGYIIFYVPDVAAAVRFYGDTFGLAQRFVTSEGDYGELDTGSTTLAFASNELASTNLSDAGGFVPLDPQGTPHAGSITLITDDVVGSLGAVEANGGRTYAAAREKPWGQTVAYAIDPFGILIEIATAVPGA